MSGGTPQFLLPFCCRSFDMIVISGTACDDKMTKYTCLHRTKYLNIVIITNREITFELCNNGTMINFIENFNENYVFLFILLSHIVEYYHIKLFIIV